jgi:nicotinate-nucleotide adenylyltransferase
MTRRIGIYPGTFDPIHQGHIAFALQAIEICKLDQVVFLPEIRPRGKENITDVNTRLNHLEQATKGQPSLITFLAMSSPFTVERTLPELRNAFPDSKMTLLIGSDVFSHISEWHNVSLLLRSVNIVVGLRHGDKPVTDSVDGSVAFIELPDTAHLSSTKYRSRPI